MNMNKVISEEQISTIVNYLLQSALPSVDVQALAKMLGELPVETVCDGKCVDVVGEAV